MRLFWALTLPEDLRDRIRGLQDSLRDRMPEARWSNPEQAHLTLSFLGEQPPGAVEPILEAGGEALSGLPALTLCWTGGSAFPRTSAARVLVLAAVPDEALVKAQRGLAAAMEPFAAPDGRPFKPHLTLARFKRPVRLEGLATFPALSPQEINRAVLFESFLGAGGAVHREIGAAVFNGPGPASPGVPREALP